MADINRTHCSVCGKGRRDAPKRRPYGMKRVMFWCNCDRNHVSAINKKAERRRGKKETHEQD